MNGDAQYGDSYKKLRDKVDVPPEWEGRVEAFRAGMSKVVDIFDIGRLDIKTSTELRIGVLARILTKHEEYFSAKFPVFFSKGGVDFEGIELTDYFTELHKNLTFFATSSMLPGQILHDVNLILPLSKSLMFTRDYFYDAVKVEKELQQYLVDTGYINTPDAELIAGYVFTIFEPIVRELHRLSWVAVNCRKHIAWLFYEGVEEFENKNAN